MAFALVFGIVMLPYANIYNYVGTGPAIAWLFSEDRRLGLAATLAELAATMALLLGGLSWPLPLLWLVIGGIVSMTKPKRCNQSDGSTNRAQLEARSPVMTPGPFGGSGARD